MDALLLNKRVLAVAPLALVAGLVFAPVSSAAPGGTPAVACGRLVDVRTLPAGTNLDLLNEAARGLGLREVPTVAGGGCDVAIRTDAYAGTTPYPRKGPVVLRAGEYAPRQQYCTDSVSVDGAFTFPGSDGPPVPGLVVFASGCTEEVNPLLV